MLTGQLFISCGTQDADQPGCAVRKIKAINEKLQELNHFAEVGFGDTTGHIDDKSNIDSLLAT